MNFSKLRNDNPWGSYESGSKKPNSGQKNNEPNIEDLLSNSQEFFKKLFGEKKGGNGGKNPKNNDATPKSLFGIVILVVLSLWLASGIFKVNPDQNGLVLLFGKYHKIAQPGLNYHIPYPLGRVIKRSVSKINTEKFESSANNSTNSRNSFYSKRSSSYRPVDTLMLTGDENIVDIDFEVQWQISDIKNFVFNLENPVLAVRKAAESAMREIIAKTPIVSALSDGKKQIESAAKSRLQEVLDSYGAGVSISLVQLRRVDPPSEVIDAFRDVQTARADKEKEINKAEAYSNSIIPDARGKAEKKIQEAEAYKAEVIAHSEGQVSRFNAVYRQYSKAKRVTRRRIYLETMEKIYRDTNKIIIDQDISKSGMIPFLPINELNKKN
ncbi:FtsH protease activity modulator HflK [Rickettsiales bacterium]|nr:FtsH protease activity modulator HflK [Rickettsiales bacterium]MDB2550658.1 FtsH protease activity modulator HflK [Rickettsiales bacterium]